MAAASLVATAFGIILILITAYILAAGILGLATSVAEGQKEMTAMSIRAMGTSLDIVSVEFEDGEPPSTYLITIENTGSEIFTYEHLDIYLKTRDATWEYFPYSESGPNGWVFNDTNDKGAWTPGDIKSIRVNGGDSYSRVQVTTAVGVSASHSISPPE
jgi:flagellar protein FlaF